MLGRGAAPVVFDDVATTGDAQQCVVGLVVGGRSKVDFVGRDDRQVAGVGEVQEVRLGLGFLAQAVALQLDIEPVAEDVMEAGEAGLRPVELAIADRSVDRSAGAAGQRDQPLGVGGQTIDPHVGRLGVLGIEEALARQLHQVGEPDLGHRQQRHVTRRTAAGLRGPQRIGGCRVREVDA